MQIYDDPHIVGTPKLRPLICGSSNIISTLHSVGERDFFSQRIALVTHQWCFPSRKFVPSPFSQCLLVRTVRLLAPAVMTRCGAPNPEYGFRAVTAVEKLNGIHWVHCSGDVCACLFPCFRPVCCLCLPFSL